MSGALYQHQEEGAAWLAARPTGRGYLGDKPGLGKTRTLLAAAQAAGAKSILVACPAIVRSHWWREAVLLDAPATFVASYDQLVRGGAGLLSEYLARPDRPDCLILDEAHYLKHATSQRTKLLLGRDGYARRLPHVFAASGTPIPKNPDEFWTALASLFPDALGRHGIRNHAEYLQRFCVVRQRFIRGRMVDKVAAELRNPDEFRALVADVMLARGLDDVGLDVPPLDWQVQRLDTKDASEAHALPIPSDIKAAIAAGALESIANDPHIARLRRKLGELKVAPVAEMLSGQLAGNDEKVAVFAHHRSVLGALRELLKEFGIAYIDGDVGPRARDEAIDRFQTDPRTRVFLGQNLACQTGITLTAARRAVLVEPDWTAVTNVQLGQRVARIGSAFQRCTAQMVALAGTLDDAIVGQHWREVRLATQAGV